MSVVKSWSLVYILNLNMTEGSACNFCKQFMYFIVDSNIIDQMGLKEKNLQFRQKKLLQRMSGKWKFCNKKPSWILKKIAGEN